MNVLLRPAMTRDEFLDWDGHEHGKWEFDGARPVLVTGGSLIHNHLMLNILMALRNRLRGNGLTALGPDSGVATVGNAVRYPDALVAPAKQVMVSKLVAGTIAAFEVLSPSSDRTDRIVKVKEYCAVATMRRYVVVESTSIGVTLYHRQAAQVEWTVTTLETGDALSLPEIGIEMSLAEIYEGSGLPETEPDEGR